MTSLKTVRGIQTEHLKICKGLTYTIEFQFTVALGFSFFDCFKNGILDKNGNRFPRFRPSETFEQKTLKTENKVGDQHSNKRII